jgi:hypothetical protein
MSHYFFSSFFEDAVLAFALAVFVDVFFAVLVLEIESI